MARVLSGSAERSMRGNGREDGRERKPRSRSKKFAKTARELEEIRREEREYPTPSDVEFYEGLTHRLWK